MSVDVRRTAALTIGALAIGVALTGGIAAAASGKTVHTCANKKTGTLRVAKHCSHKEKAYTLGSTGPRGARGAAGPSNGYQAFSYSNNSLSATMTTLMSLSLPAGSYLLNGSVGFDNLATSGLAYPGCQYLIGSGASATNSVEYDQFIGDAQDLGGGVTAIVSGSMAMTDAVKLTAAHTPVALQCQGPTTMNAYGSMTAVKVLTLLVSNESEPG
jgi:hypothetical protein